VFVSERLPGNVPRLELAGLEVQTDPGPVFGAPLLEQPTAGGLARVVLVFLSLKLAQVIQGLF
jgi:hypothetical protein